MSLCRATIVGVAVLLFGLAGCGGDNSQYLPAPRPADDEEEAAAAVAPAPSAGPSATLAATAPPAGPPPQPSAVPPPASAATPAPPDVANPPAPPTGSPSPPAVAAAPVPPTTELERRRQTIDQLTQIGRVFQAYDAKNDMYPPRIVFALSWRVGTLPLAGQTDLYLRFQRTAAWDDPQNLPLAAEIPPFLQATGLDAAKTRNLLVSGPNSAYSLPEKEGLTVETCPDGLENTILAVAVSDPYAVPWTSPQDYVFSRESVHEAFFGLYRDCCYALFGGQTGVRRIPATISDEHLLALITPAGRETVSALEVTRPPTAEPDEALLQALQQQPIVRFAAQPAPLAASPASEPKASGGAAAPTVSTTLAGSAPNRSVPPSAAAPAGGDPRLPIPDEVSQQLARRLLRETHHQEYTDATTDERKKNLAEKLLTLARAKDLDPPARYVALELSWKIALEGGNTVTALEAVDELTQTFQDEGYPERTEIFEASVGQTMPDSESERVLSEGTKWVDLALRQNELELADEALDAAMSAARRLKELKTIRTLLPREREIAAAKSAWTEAAEQLERLLADPADARANEVVGLYYCLVNQRWEDGLPLLARAADPRLADLAAAESRRPATPAEQLALADLWWNYAETSLKHKPALRARAGHWYRQALGGLPPGLDRIKAEARLAKADTKADPKSNAEPPPDSE